MKQNILNNEVRLAMLNQIFMELLMAKQWFDSDAVHYYSEHMRKAESLIEFIEVNDCGSIGGFDRDNEHLIITDNPIFDRFLTVLRKYNHENEITSSCEFDVLLLARFYKQLSSLRETVKE